MRMMKIVTIKISTNWNDYTFHKNVKRNSEQNKKEIMGKWNEWNERCF